MQKGFVEWMPASITTIRQGFPFQTQWVGDRFDSTMWGGYQSDDGSLQLARPIRKTRGS
jgi:hypothetical protein